MVTRSPLRPRDVRLLAAEYDAAPSLDPHCTQLWQDFAVWALERQATLADQFTIRLVNVSDPYSHGRELLADLIRRDYQVPAPHACPVHPIWDGQAFAASRTVHDLDGHGSAGSYFDLEGEILTVQRQAEITPEQFMPVVFSDTMQQLCSTLVNHQFAPQKVVLTEYERLLERCLS